MPHEIVGYLRANNFYFKCSKKLSKMNFLFYNRITQRTSTVVNIRNFIFHCIIRTSYTRIKL